MRKTKKQRDAEFLNGPDISTCQRCGEYSRIWHIFGKGDRRDEVTGMVCTRCFWTCGDANIITAISCFIMDIHIKARNKKAKKYLAKQKIYKDFYHLRFDAGRFYGSYIRKGRDGRWLKRR